MDNEIATIFFIKNRALEILIKNEDHSREVEISEISIIPKINLD